MAYQYLPDPLTPVAERVVQYLRDQLGLRNFRLEEEVDGSLDYRPTISTHSKDHHIVCVDVRESPYSQTLDSVVLDSIKKSLPIKLYVAFPEAPNIPDYKKQADRARSNGVGLIEVKANGIEVIHDALALSLAGLRKIKPSKFPAKFRTPLVQAESNFLRGAPVDGCLGVYKELEALSREVILKTRKNGLWKAPALGKTLPVIKSNTAWQRVLEIAIDNLDYEKFPPLSKPLLSRILSVTPFRNQTGHKVTSTKLLIARDTALRTRFESAVDVLSELIEVSKLI